MQENERFLKEQIITYLGNKRNLLNFIEQGVKFAKSELKKDKLSCLDLFSGSGVVARFLKQHSNFLVANDLESYSKIINQCYLSNIDKALLDEISTHFEILQNELKNNLKSGFISELYAPKDDENIQKNERVFYTKFNANFLDTACLQISKFDPNLQAYFLAPLIYLASNHTNTSGVFKGFYKNKFGIGEFGGQGKNALSRIKAKMELIKPVFSNFNVPFKVYQKDANALTKELDSLDLCYIDPPYNQHPYASNYFMLNLIANYERPSEISQISGIPKDWNRSEYNKKARASEAFFEMILNLKSKIVLISYNSEGFIAREEFEKNLAKFGKVQTMIQKYNTFRGSRNLAARSLYVDEYLYILKK